LSFIHNRQFAVNGYYAPAVSAENGNGRIKKKIGDETTMTLEIAGKDRIAQTG